MGNCFVFGTGWAWTGRLKKGRVSWYFIHFEAVGSLWECFVRGIVRTSSNAGMCTALDSIVHLRAEYRVLPMLFAQFLVSEQRESPAAWLQLSPENRRGDIVRVL